jgi:Flp pilus assembly protein TadD
MTDDRPQDDAPEGTRGEAPGEAPAAGAPALPDGIVVPEGLTPVVEITGPSPEVEQLLQQALELAESEAWEEVADHLRGALEDRPDDPYVLCWLGMAEREMGMDGVAYERFKRALDQEPRDPVLLATAGNALAHFDDPEAEAALRTAALLGPMLPQTRWMYGAWLAREGMLEEGIAELDVAMELDPDDGVIRTERGVALALAGRMEDAAAAFAGAVELDPEDSWAMTLLGLAQVETGDPEAAVREFDTAAHLRPDDAEAQILAALSLASVGEEDRALVMLERARLLVDEGADRQLILEVEDHLESGPEAAGRFLRMTLGPSSFRERLMQRP